MGFSLFLFNYKFHNPKKERIANRFLKQSFFKFSMLGLKSLILYRKSELAVRKGPNILKKKSGIILKLRLDIFLKLLVPGVTFLLLEKLTRNFISGKILTVLWPAEHLDILGLLLYANPIFLNTSLFDFSAYSGLKNEKSALVLFYLFKVPIISGWLVVFINQKLGVNSGKVVNVVSLEILFKSLSWAEREVSELFGVFFFFKKNNRKLISDYFLKVYPMMKWVPSVGFSEIYLSSEGFFFNRPVRVFNGALS